MEYRIRGICNFYPLELHPDSEGRKHMVFDPAFQSPLGGHLGVNVDTNNQDARIYTQVTLNNNEKLRWIEAISNPPAGVPTVLIIVLVSGEVNLFTHDETILLTTLNASNTFFCSYVDVNLFPNGVSNFTLIGTGIIEIYSLWRGVSHK